MARSQRSSRIESRTARLKLPVGKREWLTIGKGLALAYRRTGDGYGTWQARVWVAPEYRYANVGRADDYQDANGVDVLDFFQAQGAAREFYEQTVNGSARAHTDATIADAATDYLEWFRKHRRSVKETEHVINCHILPTLGRRRLADLEASELRKWLNRLAEQPARVRTSRLSTHQNFRAAAKTADQKRARRATANRILNVLRAILNRALEEALVAADSEWRKVKPFENADEARLRFLSDAEGVRLVNACASDLRALVKAALLTGARYGELVAMRTHEVDLPAALVYIAASKSGRPRHLPLNPEGVALFRDLLTGKTGEDRVFTKADGTAWGKNHHVRPLAAACKAAKVRPAIAFHELRHTYASHLAQGGVDLLTISKLLGHADTRITSKHYAHLADKTLAAAVTRLPSTIRSDRSCVLSLGNDRLTSEREAISRASPDTAKTGFPSRLARHSVTSSIEGRSMAHRNGLPRGVLSNWLDRAPTLADKIASHLADKAGKPVNAFTKEDWMEIAQAISCELEEQVVRNDASQKVVSDVVAKFLPFVQKAERRNLTKRAADKKHEGARANKQKALDLYQSGSYASMGEGARRIAKELNLSPKTVDNWLREARRSTRKVG